MSEIISENKDYFVTLASVSEIELVQDEDKIPGDAVSAVIEGAELFYLWRD